MIFQDLIDLGVNPRIAVALNRMVVANQGRFPKTASEDSLIAATKSAKILLCAQFKEAGLPAVTAESDEEEEDKEAVPFGLPPSADENEAEASDIRKDERKIAEWTVKLGYALAKHLGADEITALTASMYAFTNIPDSREVSSQVLKAEWWPNGRPQRQ